MHIYLETRAFLKTLFRFQRYNVVANIRKYKFKQLFFFVKFSKAAHFSFKKSLSNIKKQAEYIVNLHRRPQKRHAGKLCSQYIKKTKPRIYFLFRTTKYVNLH